MSLIRKAYHFAARITGFGYWRTKQKGKKVFRSLNLDPQRDTLICSHGIGDVVWMCSFINAYLQEQNLPSSIPVVCMKRDVNLIRCYLPDADITGISKQDLALLGHYTSSMGHSKVRTLIYPALKTPADMGREITLMSEIGLEMDTCYKFGCFDLERDAPFQAPDLYAYQDAAEQVIRDKALVRGKTVILVPFINSRLSLPLSEWEKIASSLTSLGYHVYTNVGAKTDTPVKGTEPLFTSLEVLPLVIKATGCAVSGRCGLGDWIFVNGCDMAVIHTYRDGKLTDIEKIQSSFARKESFRNMKARCGIGGKLAEYRLSQNGDNTIKIKNLVSEIDAFMREK